MLHVYQFSGSCVVDNKLKFIHRFVNTLKNMDILFLIVHVSGIKKQTTTIFLMLKKPKVEALQAENLKTQKMTMTMTMTMKTTKKKWLKILNMKKKNRKR